MTVAGAEAAPAESVTDMGIGSIALLGFFFFFILLLKFNEASRLVSDHL